MLTCLAPLAYLFVTVYMAGIWMTTHVYLNPAAKGHNPFNATITIIELALGVIILVSALVRWFTAPSHGEAPAA